ncbi:hypothetical protein [Bradyrhizobium elkanii]|uniref:hypothetical protein n=1 Tax=Bradyrhizobium elkanii TaxID=29448 RepID=UPI0008422F68|nr:hypothetical protein [Bradyrhizobium elkanii]ODM75036.1 hypothetical protein A6452_38965 [Bradyrhizobium elkanii]ODM82779.1 hypothetical protein A6X20_16800 [Bradyrhizobium elkanii]
METEAARKILSEALPEVMPAQFEIGHSGIEEVIECAIAGENDIQRRFSKEEGVAPNEIIDVLKELLLGAQIILVCVKIWKASKTPPKKDELIKSFNREADNHLRKKTSTDTISKVYDWLSRTPR